MARSMRRSPSGGVELEPDNYIIRKQIWAVQNPDTIGDMPGGQLLAAFFMDTLIHGWDLAKATGAEH